MSPRCKPAAAPRTARLPERFSTSLISTWEAGQAGKSPHKQDRRDASSQGEQEDAPVDGGFIEPRDVSGMEMNEEADGEGCREHSQDAAGPGEAQGLGGELADETGARGAERGTQAEFAISPVHAGEHQAGDIAASDQETKRLP